MFTVKFWKAAGERAVKSGVQFFVLASFGGVVGDFVDVTSVPWQASALAGLGGALASLLTSALSAASGNEGPAAFGPETVAPSLPSGPSALS